MYDELVKRLKEHNGWALNETLDEAADAIEELQKALDAVTDAHNEGYDVGYWAGRRDYEPCWIPVTERLPATEDHVLAATQNKAGKYNIVKAYYSHDLHCWAAGMNSNVTHWMPLPEPPKGERKEDV